MSDYTLIVADTSPLITLSQADELDLLLRLGVPVEIPDVVYLEATRGEHADAGRLRQWIEARRDQVRITPTERSAEWQILVENGRRPKGYGELAAIDVLQRHLEDQPESRPILIYEDAGLNKYIVRNPEFEMITTGTFLRELENSREIQSADQILDQAAATGRNVDRQREQPENRDLEAAFRQLRERAERDRRGERER